MNKYICFIKNNEYIYEIEDILLNNKKEILDFFEVKDNGTFDFNIYVYDKLNDMYKALKEKNITTYEITYYCAEKNTLYLYEPLDYNKKLYKKHIINEEINAIEHLIYGNHPKWLIDGITMYINNNISIKQILEDELENNYSSYIIVSYLIERYTKSLFIRLIFLKNFIDNIENNNILERALDYYTQKYNKKNKFKKKS